MSKSAIGWLLIALGGIGAAIAMVKFVIIGYYPNETIPFAILAFVGLGALWLGDRFRRQAVIDAQAGGGND